MAMFVLQCQNSRRVQASAKGLNRVANNLGLDVVSFGTLRFVDLRDKAQSDAGQVQLTNHGISRLIEDMVLGACLGAGVRGELHVIHDEFEVAARMSQITLVNREYYQARFCELSVPIFIQ